jgi:hypothetical protein
VQAFRRLGWVLFTAALAFGGRAAAQFGVPEYHSLPGAPKRLYLDFDGHDMAVPGYTPKAVTGLPRGTTIGFA